jgi:hypothetical protein
MKRSILWISAVVVAAFVMSLNAFAQAPAGGGQGGLQRGGAINSIQQLIRNTEFATMVEITPEQQTALIAALPQRQAGGGANAGGGAAARAPMTAEQQDEMWTKIFAAVKPEQAAKIKDIFFQMNVPVARPNANANAPAQQVAALNVYVLAAMDLKDDQKTKIKAITAKLDEENTANPIPGGGGGGGNNANMTQEQRDARTAAVTARNERTTKANDEIKALLTDVQKKKMADLTTAAPEVRAKLAPAPGAGGGRQPAGAGQPGAGGRGQGQGAGGNRGGNRGGAGGGAGGAGG